MQKRKDTKTRRKKWERERERERERVVGVLLIYIDQIEQHYPNDNFYQDDYIYYA